MYGVDEHGRRHPPHEAGEVETLLGFLDFQRDTLAWKTDGVDRDGMRVTVGVSSMTLGGLLKHLAFVEEYWFAWRLRGRAPSPPFDDVDWDAEPDWDWTSAAGDEPDELRALWRGACERSRVLVDEALADGLDRPAVKPWRDGRAPSLRWILVHMIEEYARHNGHADLLREVVDGQIGE